MSFKKSSSIIHLTSTPVAHNKVRDTLLYYNICKYVTHCYGFALDNVNVSVTKGWQHQRTYHVNWALSTKSRSNIKRTWVELLQMMSDEMSFNITSQPMTTYVNVTWYNSKLGFEVHVYEGNTWIAFVLRTVNLE